MVFDKIEKIYCSTLYLFYKSDDIDETRNSRGGLIPRGLKTRIVLFGLHADGPISRVRRRRGVGGL